MTEGLNPVKLAANFIRNPGQYSIEKVIDYSTETGIKLWQESTESLPINFNVTGGEVNKFIEALKERAQNMGCNFHPMEGIITIAYCNGTYLNLFNNYGQMRESDITATLMQIQDRPKK